MKASVVADWSTPHQLNSSCPELAPLLKRLAPTISSDSLTQDSLLAEEEPGKQGLRVNREETCG